MNGIDVHTLPPEQKDEIFYPSSDGQPMAETEAHILLMVGLLATLRDFFRSRPDIYVIGNMFLYYREGHPEARKAPDVMVIKGVDPKAHRRSFKTWEEKAQPCVILELTSAKTAQEDQQEKRLLYQQLGVREYFLFDPLHEYLAQQLLGYRLIGDEYELLVPAADGGVLSAELGLRLRPDGSDLALIDFRTGERLLAPRELSRLVHELKAEGRQAEEEAKELRQQATEAQKRARLAEELGEQKQQRIDELEIELARLRAQLNPPEGQGGA